MSETTRRLGSEDSETRRALLDAAEAILLEEGYAAATSRRVAARAELKPQLVHYYFRTMDDLFLALVRRGAERNLARYGAALASPQPLRALWALACDPSGVTMTIELSALANHRKSIQAELREYAERFHRLQTEALGQALERYGIDPDDFPPDVVILMLTSVSQILVLEENLGMTTGHDQMQALVERYLTQFEGPAVT